MKLLRRLTLASRSGCCRFPDLCRVFAWALDYPSQPVRLIVAVWRLSVERRIPVARQIGPRSCRSDSLSPSSSISRPGLCSNVGTDAVAQQRPTENAALFDLYRAAINANTPSDKLNFNFIRDIPLRSFLHLPAHLWSLLVQSVPLRQKHFSEFIAYAKANPG